MKPVFSMVLLFCLVITNLNAKEREDVLVNGKAYDSKVAIKYGDTIETKKASKLRFKIGKDAFLVNEKSNFTLTKKNGTNVFDLVKGSVMGVFSKGKHELKTPNLTAGIRGTAIFAKVKGDKTYFCTCYGEVEVDTYYSTDSKVLHASHHNMVWVSSDKIKDTAFMKFHTDDELRSLEKMVDRVPSFDK